MTDRGYSFELVWGLVRDALAEYSLDGNSEQLDVEADFIASKIWNYLDPESSSQILPMF